MPTAPNVQRSHRQHVVHSYQYRRGALLAFFRHGFSHPSQIVGIPRYRTLKVTTFAGWLRDAERILGDHDFNMTARTAHNGPDTKLLTRDQEKALLDYVLDRRRKELAVSRRLITVKAIQIDDTIGQLTPAALQSFVTRVMQRHKLVLRRVTSTTAAGASARATGAETAHYLDTMRQILETTDPKDILNMDETGVWFVMEDRYVVEQKTSRDARVAVPVGSKKRLTAALTVSADGDKLPPLLIFQAKRNGALARKYEDTGDGYPEDLTVSYQENAWMDGEGMILFLTTIVEPYVKARLAATNRTWNPEVVDELACVAAPPPSLGAALPPSSVAPPPPSVAVPPPSVAVPPPSIALPPPSAAPAPQPRKRGRPPKAKAPSEAPPAVHRRIEPTPLRQLAPASHLAPFAPWSASYALALAMISFVLTFFAQNAAAQLGDHVRRRALEASAFLGCRTRNTERAVYAADEHDTSSFKQSLVARPLMPDQRASFVSTSAAVCAAAAVRSKLERDRASTRRRAAHAADQCSCAEQTRTAHCPGDG